MNRCVSLILTIAFATVLHAQTNPLSSEAKASFREVIDNIVKSGEMMPEINFDFKPVPTVRSFGEILGHVADYNYIFCGLAKGEQNNPDNEKTAYYAESNSTGPGANPSARVPWSHQITPSEARQYLPAKFLRGTNNWQPEAEAATLP